MNLRGRIIDIVEKAQENRCKLLEAYILEYLTQTGCSIEELTIVEEIKGNKVLLYLAKKSDIG